MGENYYVTFTAPDNNSTHVFPPSGIDVLLTHNITVSKDREGHYYLFHHSFVPSRNALDYFGQLHFFQTLNRLTQHTVLVCFHWFVQ